MSSINKVILIGNVGQDPEVRHTAGGKTVAQLSIATTERYGDNETTEWHRVVLWEKLADVAAAYVTKGKQVYIEGRLQTRSYDDKDGNKRYITEIAARDMRMLGRKDDPDSGGETRESASEASTPKPATRRGRKPKTQTNSYENQEYPDSGDLPF